MSAAEGEEQVAESPNVDFTPVVTLPEVETRTLEEDEEEMFKIRARLFRYAMEVDPPEWKERGTGDVRMLTKRGRNVRLVMRRDKTLKICANHFITAQMELRPNKGSDRAWVYSTMCDFADEEQKVETLAIRFANSTNAQAFKDNFEKAVEIAEALEEAEGAAAASSDAKAEEKEEEKPAEGKKEEEKNESSSDSNDTAVEEVAEKLKDVSVAAEEDKEKTEEAKPSEDESKPDEQAS